ncbi:MAG: DUF5333 domain-containing protein, partial [Litoreibacter sp.]|nr:DUF5333 domain-containing protein [Litoreibacter sp.]
MGTYPAERHWRGLPVRAALLAAGVMASVSAGAASGASARVPLQEDPTIENGLVIVAIGDAIRDNCAAISPKFFRAYGFARRLYNRARKLGYAHDEIEAYLDSDADKARVRGKASAYLEKRGVVADDPKTYCTAGL